MPHAERTSGGFPGRLPPASFPSRLAGRMLAPVSLAYGVALAARRRYWQRRAQAACVPVVSVGNITCGGTGKTPAVEMVVRDLAARGWTPAILSRGYRASRRRAEDGARRNDEYLVLRSNLPDVPHFQGPDRLANARRAVASGADVLVLDDGFQHLRLARDLDIVLLDALRPFDNGRLLPAGLLREPLAALARADLVAITRVELAAEERLRTLEEFLRDRFPRVSLLRIASVPCHWQSFAGEQVAPNELGSREVAAVCAIGNPFSFRLQLEALGLVPRVFVAFRDHHVYVPRDLARCARRAEKAGIETVVMTEKDAVKIPPALVAAAGDPRSWWFLRIRQEIRRGGEAYAAALDRLGRT